MAVVMKMRWEGVTPEKYDAVRDIAQWETDVPEGAIFHVVWFTDGGANVIDVWDSPEQFEAFGERLMPATAQVGIDTEPQIEFEPAHRVFDARKGEAWS